MNFNRHPSKYIKNTAEVMDTLNEQLDLKPLQRVIRRRLGYSQVKIDGQVAVRSRGNDPSIHFESQDLKQYAGIMSKNYEYLNITNFSSAIFLNTDEETVGWVSVHFSWKYIYGGTNGTDIFEAYYNFDQQKWEFGKSVWERAEEK